jgi:hypothetical protein
MKIVVEFENQEELCITVNDTTAGRLYFDLTQSQHNQQSFYFRDNLLWTEEYLIELAHQAKKAFGWNWFSDNYDLSVTTQLHKDLENSVGQLGFENVPEKYDSLLYDLHHCLHAVQNGSSQQLRSDNFQIEWMTDNSVALPNDFEFVPETSQGDLLLINPYVGHNPLQIYWENDFSSLETTCRFHDIIKPAIVIGGTTRKTVSKETVLEKFQQQDPEFVKKHGSDKIKYYSGNAVIGQVDNINVFKKIQSCPTLLKLNNIQFYD